MEVMDQNQKESLSQERNEIIKKCCADCKTTKTPLWRCGPDGPKSLCNACGIKYRKRRNGGLGVNKGTENKKEKPTTTTKALRMRLMGFGKEVVMLGEEEQAAVLLMALSCGQVVA